MAVIIPVVSKFDDKGIKQAQSAFAGLGSSMKGILGAAGIGLGLNAVVSGLKESASAAIEDVKSQALLAQQLRNTVGATDGQIKSVEDSIAVMQRQAAVADDVIRPAFASLVRATGDVGQATKLTSLALDVAAGTGKDLGTVSLALGKSINGSNTALLKLIPSIKGAADPMGMLAQQFKGAAEAAANNDPIQQMSIVMQDLQEQIGMYLLPALKDLAKYLSSTEFKDSVDSAFTGFDKIFGAVDTLIGRIPVLGDAFKGLGAQLANGNWTKFIPIIGSWIDIINNNNPARGSNAASSRLTNQALAYQASQRLAGGTKTGITQTNPKASIAAAQAAAKKVAAEQAKIAKALADALKQAKSDIAQANKDIVSEYQDSVKAFEEQTKAISDYKTQIGDLVGSTKPLAFEEKQVGRFASAVIDSFDSISANIKDNSAMFSDGGASLQKYVATERVLLEDLAAQRDALATKYSLAKAVKSDIESAILSFGNITNLLDKQSTQVTETLTSVVDGIQLTRTKLVEQTTTSGIVANFQAILDKTKAFAKSLKKLRALGLDQNLYKQIVDAGVEAGGQTAEAILAGGSDTVNSLNSIFKDLNSVGADIGEQTAQVMYGAGVDLTNGLLEGIKSQDQALMDQANAMAKLFADTFNGMVSQLIIQPNQATSPTLASQYPGFSDYINGALAGYSGDALASQIDMLTGANVSAPGSFMNSLGYMKSNPITVNVNAGMIANKQEIPAMIVDALGTYTKQSGAGGLTRVLGL